MDRKERRRGKRGEEERRAERREGEERRKGGEREEGVEVVFGRRRFLFILCSGGMSIIRE